MFNSLSDATNYVIKNIQNIDPENGDIDEILVRETIEDALLDKLEDVVTPKDLEMLAEKLDDDEFIQSYMETNVRNYYTLLDECVKEILSDYIMDQEEGATV